VVEIGGVGGFNNSPGAFLCNCYELSLTDLVILYKAMP